MKLPLSLLISLALFCQVSLADNGKLTVATFIEPPFSYLVDNKFVGEHVDVVKKLLEPLGFTPVFIHCPFARCLSLVKQGIADMMFGLKKLPEREEDLIFINPPYMEQHYPLHFFTLASRNIAINGPDDLNKLVVGVLRGASYFDLFDNDNIIAKVEFTTRKQLVDMLLLGRIDTFIEREDSILPLLPFVEYTEKISLANYQFDKVTNAYIAISKQSGIKVHAERLSKQLHKLVKSGTIKTIRMKVSN